MQTSGSKSSNRASGATQSAGENSSSKTMHILETKREREREKPDRMAANISQVSKMDNY
jgi:hypothetical protein